MKMFERVIAEGENHQHQVCTYGWKIRRQIQLVNDRRNNLQRREICGCFFVDLWMKRMRIASRACDRVPLVGAEISGRGWGYSDSEKAMYEGTKTRVKVNGRKVFSVRVGVQLSTSRFTSQPSATCAIRYCPGGFIY